MAMEIEAKVRIADAAAVERALRAIGATYRGAWLQTDTFFDHPDRALVRQDAALRLRVNRPLDDAAAAAGPSAQLTYKGPRLEGRLKQRAEHEVTVPDAAAMAEILHQLNYGEAFCYEKRRRRWRLPDGAEVTVDELPRLGRFVEVEAASETVVERLLDALGFAGRPRITESYIKLLTAELGADFGSEGLRFHESQGSDSA